MQQTKVILKILHFYLKHGIISFSKSEKGVSLPLIEELFFSKRLAA